ncbi:unnamed protein product [Cladocopium goreaui]|uniref:Clavaminate synthase 1 n=1 Tax=Cladocopium goreaui TaxID=2562237 RepID=A0A9P1D480_9DINO|nr:unnamed protein product [Cladocopium goreaui]
MKDSSPKFEVWVSEAMKKYEASFPKTEVSKEATPEPKEKAKEVVYKGDPKEISHLKQVTQRQQEEISRLLLTIDELRKRLENIRVVSMDAGPGVASSVDNIMEKVGLKDIMDPSFTAGIPRAPPVLKGVFERLYSDAIQRIQRRQLDSFDVAMQFLSKEKKTLDQSPPNEQIDVENDLQNKNEYITGCMACFKGLKKMFLLRDAGMDEEYEDLSCGPEKNALCAEYRVMTQYLNRIEINIYKILGLENSWFSQQIYEVQKWIAANPKTAIAMTGISAGVLAGAVGIPSRESTFCRA